MKMVTPTSPLMTRTQAVGPRFRQKKLSTKAVLSIVRENEVTKIEDDQQRNIQKIETGVEKGEEVEHHLQAAIKSSQAVALGRKTAQAAIPTPHTEQSKVKYDELYSLHFSQPATYIRFSSTVEDCSGAAYCMTSEDDVFFQSLGPKRTASALEPIRCSEDQFERLMSFYEETAQTRQPFAAVDSSPLVTLEEMESVFDETIDDEVRLFAKDVYDYWAKLRTAKENRPLLISLKLETGVDTDDSDPYVCFRRREVRQVRKTRGRDAQSTDKLRALRHQLEDSRQLIAMVKQREQNRRDCLKVERQIFEARAQFRAMKRKIGNKDADEDLLVNQKPKKKPVEAPVQPIRVPARMPSQTVGRAPEADLMTLKQALAERESKIQAEIDLKIAQHKKWNQGWVDQTRAPFTLTSLEDSSTSFRTAVTEYLPTPPASETSGASPPANAEQTETQALELRSPVKQEDVVSFRYSSPPLSTQPQNHHPQPQFRRRFGRGGRIFIDRRHGPRGSFDENIDPIVRDRHKYDLDDDDDEVTVYNMDPYAPLNMRYRANIMYSSREQQAHAQQIAQAQAAQAARRSQAHSQGQDVAMVNGASTAGAPLSSSPTRPGGGHV